MNEYLVRTDVYNGPMDLLLYLIRREEVDLYDIPIARITEQYVEYVRLLQAIDPNVAGDFLVLAATLMEIKSRMLLPRAPVESDEVEDLSDPRLELVRQLLEYKKFKDASLQLAAAAQRQAAKWPRVPARPSPAASSEFDLEDVQIWDLVAAFNKLMAAIGAGAATHDVIFDDTPIALHAADVLDRLQRDGGELAFDLIFAGRGRSEMIGLFLALLELMRQQRIRVTQTAPFAPILIVLISAEPIQVGEEWEPALREAVRGGLPHGDDGRSGDGASADAVTAEAGTDVGPTPLAAGERESDDDLDEPFEELDRIKTDLDMDAVLKRANGRDPNDPSEDNPS